MEKLAREMLYRSCFLLNWTLFEVFLRSTIHELFRMHPHMLALGNRANKPVISYADVVCLSESFSSLDALRHAMVEKQIDQNEGQSLHSLINFLKSEFRFESDPYKAWYVFYGQGYETDYNTLIEIKKVRNALIHDGGAVSDDFMLSCPNISYRDGSIIIDEDYYLKAKLVLRSIAYGIANSIVLKKYDTGDEPSEKEVNKGIDSDGTG